MAWERPDGIALYIDGPNLYATAKAPGFDIDQKRLLKDSKVVARCCARSTTPPSLKIRNIRRSVP
jgi:uncharacterized LabA/DUF88 family protein